MNLSMTRVLLDPRSGFPCKRLLGHFFSLTTAYRTTSSSSLYRRISPLGDPKVSIVPILDQWVQEGKAVDEDHFRDIIKELSRYRRFKHALEISRWMSDKRYITLRAKDIALRMNLIFKVHGLEQVEKYFNNIHGNLKNSEVHIALLNCYAEEKSVDKAEALFERMRDLGFARATRCYNTLMNAYCRVGNWEKLDVLMHEMEENGIPGDKFTFSIRLSALASAPAPNIEGIDRMVMRMESDSQVRDWVSYAVAANGYLKAGQAEKALAMMKKLEVLIKSVNGSNFAFHALLKLYAEARKRDELDRIWKLYKEKKKIYNKGYITMISSVLTFGEIETAEKIFEEWESRILSCDFRIPNLLIDAYCREGHLEKAETLVNRILVKGGNPSVDTWFYLANGYLEENRIPKAVEALKKAVLVCGPSWKPSKDTLTTCLEYLEGNGDMGGAGKFITDLQNEGIFSKGVCNRLLSYIEDGKSQHIAVDQLEEGVLVEKREVQGTTEPRQESTTEF